MKKITNFFKSILVGFVKVFYYICKNFIFCLLLFYILYLSGNISRQTDVIFHFGALTVFSLFLYLTNLLLRTKSAGVWVYAENEVDSKVFKTQRFKSLEYKITENVTEKLFILQKQIIEEIKEEHPEIIITKVEIIK